MAKIFFNIIGYLGLKHRNLSLSRGFKRDVASNKMYYIVFSLSVTLSFTVLSRNGCKFLINFQERILFFEPDSVTLLCSD